MSWSVSEWIAALSLGLTIFVLAAGIVHRLMRGQYATRDWVEAKLRPVTDEQVIIGGRIRDVDSEHKLLKERIAHMPTVEHLDEIKDRMAKLSETNAVHHTENKTELQNMRHTLEGIREDLQRRDR